VIRVVERVCGKSVVLEAADEFFIAHRIIGSAAVPAAGSLPFYPLPVATAQAAAV
jgi:hypothetical protein